MKCVLIDGYLVTFLQKRYMDNSLTSLETQGLYSKIVDKVSVELSKEVGFEGKWAFFENQGGTGVFVEALVEIVNPRFFDALIAGLKAVSPEWVICFESSYSGTSVVEGVLVSEDLVICANTLAAKRMLKKHPRYFEVWECE